MWTGVYSSKVRRVFAAFVCWGGENKKGNAIYTFVCLNKPQNLDGG